MQESDNFLSFSLFCSLLYLIIRSLPLSVDAWTFTYFRIVHIVYDSYIELIVCKLIAQLNELNLASQNYLSLIDKNNLSNKSVTSNYFIKFPVLTKNYQQDPDQWISILTNYTNSPEIKLKICNKLMTMTKILIQPQL